MVKPGQNQEEKIDKNRSSRLLDLPDDVIYQIGAQECLTNYDRLCLALTCKAAHKALTTGYAKEHPVFNPGVYDCFAIRNFARHRELKSHVLKRLLKDPRCDPDSNHGEALYNAVRHGRTRMVAALIRSGRVDPNTRNGHALLWACLENLESMVKVLLEHPKIDVNVNNLEALSYSVTHSNVRVLKLLLADPRLNIKAAKNCPAAYAAERGNFEAFRELVNHKDIGPRPRVTVQEDHLGLFPPDLSTELVVLVSMLGHVIMVKYLIDVHKVDPSIGGSLALRAAAHSNQTHVVKLLLKDGRCDPAVNNNSILIEACGHGHETLVRLLLEDGRADPHAQQGQPFAAAASGNHMAVMRLLNNYPRRQ